MVKAKEVVVRLVNANIEDVVKAVEGFTIEDMTAYGIGELMEPEVLMDKEVVAEVIKEMVTEEVQVEEEVAATEEEPKAEEKIEKVFDDVDDVEEEKPKAKAAKSDYDKMTMAELRDEIEARGLDAKSVKKQPLVDALLADDKGATSEEIDEADETDENVGSKYEGRKAMDLFKEAKDRGLKVKPRQKAAFYVDILEENDAEQLAKQDDTEEEVWEDIDEDEDEWDI